MGPQWLAALPLNKKTAMKIQPAEAPVSESCFFFAASKEAT
jgi:hypothetical protein